MITTDLIAPKKKPSKVKKIALGLAYVVLKVMPKILMFIGLVSGAVLAHELGHFLVAHYYGITAESFNIGFGPSLLSFSAGGTEFHFRAIPLGGYNAFAEGSMAALSITEEIAILISGCVVTTVLAALLLYYMVSRKYWSINAMLPVRGNVLAKHSGGFLRILGKEIWLNFRWWSTCFYLKDNSNFKNFYKGGTVTTHYPATVKFAKLEMLFLLLLELTALNLMIWPLGFDGAQIFTLILNTYCTSWVLDVYQWSRGMFWYGVIIINLIIPLILRMAFGAKHVSGEEPA